MALVMYSSPLWLALLVVVVGITVRAIISRDQVPFLECWTLGAMHTAVGLGWAPLVVVSWPVATPPTRYEELRAALRN